MYAPGVASQANFPRKEARSYAAFRGEKERESMLQVKRSTIFLYLLPIIVSIAFISMTPILYTLYLSFTNNTEFNQEYNFVGLTNYIHLLFTSNSDLFYVLRQTILYVIACTLLFVLVGMITALALNNPKVKGTAVWMSLLLIPWAAPSAVTVFVLQFLFNSAFWPPHHIGHPLVAL